MMAKPMARACVTARAGRRGAVRGDGMEALQQEIKVSVRGLELGMFVCRLDRPWLESRFPLQGFTIRSEQELHTLQRICSHVYVDIANGRSPDPRYVELEHAHVVEAARERDEFNDLRKTTWFVETGLAEELPRAEAAMDLLTNGIQGILDDLKLGRGLDLKKLRQGVDEMIGSITRNPAAFGWLREIKRKDSFSYHHALACSVWAASFGRHLGLEVDELRDLALGGLLFDVGKTLLPERLLLADEESLLGHEREQLRRHVEHGLEILQNTPGITPQILEMVATHHERHDGSGYPAGLKGSAIPIGGRILGVVDTYDMLTGVRKHATGLSPHQAVGELYQARGTLFQPELVEQFIQTCGIYPTGSLVELSDGQVGVVTAVHSLKRLRPNIMLLLDETRLPLPQFRTIDLGEVREDAHGRPLTIKGGLAPGSFGIDLTELFLD
jgi:HD-GYP domain-containing protein (c-di-GMP phosphodiesterase class II)